MKRLVIATLLVTFLTVSIAPVMAIDLKTAKNEKSTVDSRINKLNADKKKALALKAKLEQQKKQVTNAQAAENNAYKELVSQISGAEESIRQTEKALEEAKANYNQQRELLKTRLRVMYQNSSATKLDTLLESKSLVEFYERLQYMSIITRNDSRIIDDLNQAKLDVEYKEKLQLEAKELLEKEASDKQQRLTSLKNSRSVLENEIIRSKAALAIIEKDIDAENAESERLNDVIKSLTLKGNKKYAGGSMLWPLPSSTNITSGFGLRKHPILRKYKLHTGIDIAGNRGASIIAANKGTVIIAKYEKSYGLYVVIDHGGGITTLYSHASKLLVKVGDEVKSGDVIAKVGSTGLSTGNHLHFEVRENGVPKNPLSGYVSK